MTRSELVTKLADSAPHLRPSDADAIVTMIFDQITSALALGQRVELRGFGAFAVKRRNARVGRNPRTGEEVRVDEKDMPYFRASRATHDRLNRPVRQSGQTTTASSTVTGAAKSRGMRDTAASPCRVAAPKIQR